MGAVTQEKRPIPILRYIVILCSITAIADALLVGLMLGTLAISERSLVSIESPWYDIASNLYRLWDIVHRPTNVIVEAVLFRQPVDTHSLNDISGGYSVLYYFLSAFQPVGIVCMLGLGIILAINKNIRGQTTITRNE